MGSLEHAKTELLNFLTWKWKESLPYLNYSEIYSFTAFFYNNHFYVVGGRTKNEVLSTVTIFNPITENWTEIGNLKFPRYDHTIDVIGDTLYIVGGSENFEYCDLLNDFGCSKLNDARFEQKDYPTLFGFYPSKCELGNVQLLKSSTCTGGLELCCNFYFRERCSIIQICSIVPPCYNSSQTLG